MKAIHWMVLVTSLLIVLLMWLPVYLMRKIFISMIMVASQASEEVFGVKMDLPIK